MDKKLPYLGLGVLRDTRNAVHWVHTPACQHWLRVALDGLVDPRAALSKFTL